MPYLQLDVSRRISIDLKRQLTRRLADLYADDYPDDARRGSCCLQRIVRGQSMAVQR